MHLKSVSVQTLDNGDQRLTAELLVEGRVTPSYVVRTFRRGMSLGEAGDALYRIARELWSMDASDGRD